ncbi:RdgB/HAM1 family non-canonical purine NTP pyrophosphatase [Amylibacter sp.]|jgi:XTP/dITP diphosphohydrolase|nr:putative deoxyribonucleotide triphosphate pyrophosphatase [alpha proteobacterium HTCC2255] [Rhodobacterales bacterium HTCC2255]MCO4795905.1 RdgB/HAM1 family non-canonical purine NTP pyrophosphatase [Amylibacter sp.]MDA8752287.1 RdgB/HAM1 family non-canonical purine NTP pyrophosphatase [Amylibacter sp.]MDA8757159.1 RdgB/HAM1 family non-canonical purine NTP pyrophosphatase [Amylibacter sp.]MDA9288123.1 RdgB/HAM1 family non-canonical purine NTP pyrophosphatase [Amylibacter sp.]|tara:strand:- start:2125 stop:2730 length:606 start_codon:yes stop_codon:yes gene_type:complete
MRKLNEKQIVLASHNKGKLKEIGHLLKPFGISVISASDLGLDEPEETENTYAGNARIKAHFAAKASGKPALSDDSGFSVEILDGAPGVYSADWAETSNGRNFSMAMSKIWDKIQHAEKPCKAKFCCTLCLAWPDGHDELFEGSINGEIAWPPRGNNGFGYDPMFIAEGMHQTFGEMLPTDKHLISHRADAFKKLIKTFEKE